MDGKSCGGFEERVWQGRIVGYGIHGALNALLIKHRNLATRSDSPLIGLLTVCVKCRDQPIYLSVHRLSRMIKAAPGKLVLTVVYEEIADFISSKQISMEDVLMDTINTIECGGQQKEWRISRPIF
jgi:hypothetical protein